MKKNIIKICLILTLILGINAYTDFGQSYAAPKARPAKQTQVQKKTSPRKVLLKKFFIAMLGVACSGCAIYLLLFLYRKYTTDNNIYDEANYTDDASLYAPNNMDGAIKQFLTRMK